MSSTPACPEVSVLQQLALGKLSPEQVADLTRHCEQCPRCIEALNSLNAGTFLDRLHALPSSSSLLGQTTTTYAGVDSPSDADDAEAFASNASVNDIDFAPAQAPDEIGRLGGYRILKKLGAGGMGVVYLAEDVQLQRPIAVKVMKAEVARNPGYRDRFLREARAAAKIKSDHVVTIYQVGEERQIVYLAMELLEGFSLADWLKHNPNPSLAQATRIGRQIALGLADAHACGLIHRDIKPDNIWLDSRHQDRVKLLDFGLARVHTEQVQLTHASRIVGTPGYMAPEQARGDKIDPRCDLFSLGVVLYRLTTGRMPFRGDNFLAMLTALAVYTPPPPREINSAIPPRLATLIERLLAKDRELRPATAKAVAEELALLQEATSGTTSISTSEVAEAASPVPFNLSGGLLRSEASPREPTPLIQRLQRPSRSRLRWLVAASLLLLLGASAAGILVYLETREAKAPDVRTSPGTKGEIVVNDKPPPIPEPLSVLDSLDAAMIPDEERIAGLPRETVAVLGSHRGWHRQGNGDRGAFLAYAPEGRKIVTVIGRRGGISLWDAGTLRQLGRIEVTDYFVAGLAFAPDGKSLALATNEDNGTVRFWDVSADAPVERLPALENKEPIHAMSYSPDGKLLACLVGDKQLLRLWDLTAKPPKMMAELHDAHKDSPPTFAPDGKSLVYGNDKTGLLVWDVSTNPPRKIAEFPQAGGIFRTAFSSDGKTLAAADSANTVHLLDWNGVALKERAAYPSPPWQARRLSSLAFSPQGKKMAFSCMDHCPRLVDWSGPQARDFEFNGYQIEPFNLLAFSPDGQTLAAFSCDYYEGKLRLWDATGPKLVERSGRPGHVNSVRALVFSRDGKLLVSGGERNVRLWQPIGGRFEQKTSLEHPEAITKLALSHDSKTLAVMGKETLRLWDLSGPHPKMRVSSQGDVGALVFSPDGKSLAWSEGADVHLGELAAAKPVETTRSRNLNRALTHLSELSKRKPVEKTVLRGHQQRVEALAISPDGRTLASGGQDNTIRLWNWAQEKRTTRALIRLAPPTLPDEQVGELFFLADGKSLLVKKRENGQVWDVAQPEPRMKWEFTCNGGELCMTPAPDGRSIFSVGAGATREMLQCWYSSGDMRPWWVPGGHLCLAMAADGRHLALGNANGTIYVLRLPTRNTAHPPLEDAWVKETAALSLSDQLDAAAKKLKERNPDFDGELKRQIDNGELVEVDLSLKRLFDLTPLQVLRPRRLNLSETYSVADLSPLRGMPLEALYLGSNRSIADFTPLKELPLKKLRFDAFFEPAKLAPLRSIETLETINDKPAAEFWKDVDAGKKP